MKKITHTVYEKVRNHRKIEIVERIQREQSLLSQVVQRCVRDGGSIFTTKSDI